MASENGCFVDDGSTETEKRIYTVLWIDKIVFITLEIILCVRGLGDCRDNSF